MRRVPTISYKCGRSHNRTPQFWRALQLRIGRAGGAQGDDLVAGQGRRIRGITGEDRERWNGEQEWMDRIVVFQESIYYRRRGRAPAIL